MSFEIQRTCAEGSGARRGLLAGRVHTPALLSQTHAGAPPFLLPAGVAALPGLDGLCVSFSDMYPYAKAIAACNGEEEKKGGGGGGGLASFTAQADHALFVSCRDPGYVPVKANEVGGICVDGARGRKVVPAAEYARVLAAMRPAFAMAPADELPQEGFGKKRCRTAVDRTVEWLDALLAEQTAVAEAAPPPRNPPVPVFGVVLGGLEPRLRAQSAAETAKRGVAGFVLAGFGLGESTAVRASLLAEVLPLLPPASPRLLMGVGAPADVVALVAGGIDALAAAYPLTLMQQGYASTFDIPGVDRKAAVAAAAAEEKGASRRAKRPRLHGGGGGGSGGDEEQEELTLGVAPGATAAGDGDGGDPIVDASAAARHGKIQLRDRRWKRDRRPLLPGCGCDTCRCYSRAYVTHLLNCNEMLASTLLYAHNLHHYLLFFEQMRKHIDAGQFASFANHFGVELQSPPAQQAAEEEEG